MRRRNPKELKAAKAGLARSLVAFFALLSLVLTLALWKGNQNLSKATRSVHLDGTRTTIRDLETRKSSVPGAAAGLFTKKKLKKGAFVGFYCGNHYHYTKGSVADQEKDFPKDWWMYALRVTRENIVVPDNTNERHRMCLANEPPENVATNMITIEYPLVGAERISASGAKMSQAAAIAIGMFASREIEAGEELFWYYGGGYEEKRNSEGYSIRSDSVTKREVGEEGLESPTAALGTPLPLDCFVSVEQPHRPHDVTMPPFPFGKPWRP